jgi:hypothetical protein
MHSLSRAEVACAQRRPRHPLEGNEVMETFRNTIASVLTIRHVSQAVAFYERAFGDEEIYRNTYQDGRIVGDGHRRRAFLSGR